MQEKKQKQTLILAKYNFCLGLEFPVAQKKKIPKKLIYHDKLCWELNLFRLGFQMRDEGLEAATQQINTL